MPGIITKIFSVHLSDIPSSSSKKTSPPNIKSPSSLFLVLGLCTEVRAKPRLPNTDWLQRRAILPTTTVSCFCGILEELYSISRRLPKVKCRRWSGKQKHSCFRGLLLGLHRRYIIKHLIKNDSSVSNNSYCTTVWYAMRTSHNKIVLHNLCRLSVSYHDRIFLPQLKSCSALVILVLQFIR